MREYMIEQRSPMIHLHNIVSVRGFLQGPYMFPNYAMYLFNTWDVVALFGKFQLRSRYRP